MDKENILYRIISGYYYIYIDNIRYKIMMPTLSMRQEAHDLYLKFMDQYKYDVNYWLSQNQIDILLKHYNLWNLEKEAKFKETQNKLDDTKVDLYLNFIDFKIKEKNKVNIKNLNKILHTMLVEKTYLDNLTLEAYCNSLKNQYIIMNCIYDTNNKKIFDNYDFDNIDSIFLDKILYEIYNNSLNIEDLKEFAKSDLWKSYWDAQKEYIFDKHVLELTDDQRTLINISKTLDAIREHIDAPSSDIINDNDALDGWMIYQFRKKEEEQKKIKMDNRASTAIKHKDHSNVFFMTRDNKEKQQIYGMNDQFAKHEIKKMFNTVENKGSMNLKDFTIFKQQQLNKDE